jgi:hypothetical protein
MLTKARQNYYLGVLRMHAVSISQEILSRYPTLGTKTLLSFFSHSPPQFGFCLMGNGQGNKATVSRRYHHVVSGRYHYGETV